MARQQIRDLVIEVISERIGVLGGVLVDDVLGELGIGQDGLNDRHMLTRFLVRLKKELPEDLDASAIAEELRAAIYCSQAAR